MSAPPGSCKGAIPPQSGKSPAEWTSELLVSLTHICDFSSICGPTFVYLWAPPWQQRGVTLPAHHQEFLFNAPAVEQETNVLKVGRPPDPLKHSVKAAARECEHAGLHPEGFSLPLPSGLRVHSLNHAGSWTSSFLPSVPLARPSLRRVVPRVLDSSPITVPLQTSWSLTSHNFPRQMYSGPAFEPLLNLDQVLTFRVPVKFDSNWPSEISHLANTWSW